MSAQNHTPWFTYKQFMHVICAPIAKGIGENGSRVLPTAPSHMDKQYSPDFSSSWVIQIDFIFV